MATYLCVKAGNQTKSYEVKSSANKPYMRVSTGYLPLTTETTTDTGIRIKSGTNTYRMVESYTTTSKSTSYYNITKNATFGSHTYYVYQNVKGYAYVSRGTYQVYTGTAISSLDSNGKVNYTAYQSARVPLTTCTGEVYSHYYSAINASSSLYYRRSMGYWVYSQGKQNVTDGATMSGIASQPFNSYVSATTRRATYVSHYGNRTIRATSTSYGKEILTSGTSFADYKILSYETYSTTSSSTYQETITVDG